MYICEIFLLIVAIEELHVGFTSAPSEVSNDTIVYIFMGGVVLSKFVLGTVCTLANRLPNGLKRSDQLDALATDHLNDVVSNAGAMVTLAIAANTTAVRDNLLLVSALEDAV